MSSLCASIDTCNLHLELFVHSLVSYPYTTNRSIEVGVRLKLYWQTGYYWQENTEETWWCMSCPDGVCKLNDKLELRNCKRKSSDDAMFVVQSHGKGHQYRVTGTDLCMMKMFSRRAIKLKTCTTKGKRFPLQLFDDFKANGEKFDLRPVKYTSRCLSNHHHPKAGEQIYAETCQKAHKTKTGYWVAY